MKNKDFLSVTMVIFLIVAVVHLWRAVTSTPVSFGSMMIPVWASWIAGLVAAYLCYTAYKLRK